MLNFEELFNETKIIAILRGIPSDKLIPTLDALYEGGVRLAEITYDNTDTVPDEGTASDIGRAVMHTEGRMLIGAGTVLRQNQVTMTAAVGGRFIISPDTNPAIIEATKNAGLLSLPGAMTVTEVCSAVAAGADYVKLFPVNVLGPSFVKAILAPLRNAKLIAVGGITPENIPEYLKAGCIGFGIGTNIANSKLASEGKFDVIAENARKFIEACK